MPKNNIRDKFSEYRKYRLFIKLDPEQRSLIEQLTIEFQLTYQEFRRLVQICRDLDMWGEETLHDWWISFGRFSGRYQNLREEKKHFLSLLNEYIGQLQAGPRTYSTDNKIRPVKPAKNKVVVEDTGANVFGWCPVASEKTVCCNLRTIDAVQSCAFGCSYCTIQTFYNDKIIIENNLAEKLSGLQLEPARRYHIGTGQSSDSLLWGNRNGLLDDLFAFARNNPNVLLEFKTKSDNIEYFLTHDIPANIVCSWSLNPQIIIENEEHYTASLERRLLAARRVADRGGKVSFHFHPIIYYNNWEADYLQIVRRVLAEFRPREVLFISFGSVTFIKPVIRKIRERGLSTKILQMDFVTDPHGKLTYSDEIKIKKFSTLYRAFEPWHGRVFFYLCMEKASIWQRALGFVFEDNESFEQAMLSSCFEKLTSNAVA